MNIREIAKLAEVSVSTVSKVINGKDQNISQQTKERVMKIVKQNNYVPYSDFRKTVHQKSLLIGVMINEKAGHEPLLKPILDTAKQRGYHTIVCTSSDAVEEKKNLNSLLSHHVDGVLWDRCKEIADGLTEDEMANRKIPFSIIDCHQSPAPWNDYFDYKKIGYVATEQLISKKHLKIACLIEKDEPRSKNFMSGYQQCLYQNKIQFDATLCPFCEEQEQIDELMIHHPTAIICFNIKLAKMVYHAAARMNLRIPQDLSVIAISQNQEDTGFIPKLSVIRIPYEDLGRAACNHLIEKIEKKKSLDVTFSTEFAIESNSSIDVPNRLRNQKIVVVGAMNMDTLVNMGCYPKPGETIRANNRVVIPGGKGVNQAIGAAKLGAEVHLIGKIGKDYDGSVLYDFLNANHVNVGAIVTDPKVSTGHAYIYVKEDGESGIVIYNGANQNLHPIEIGKNEAVFENASFCLLQTEIQMETVEYAAKLAKKHGAKVILKPAAISKIADALLEHVDIFIPNKNELRSLFPGHASLEQKAQHFLDRGVKDVIITLGHRGCYWRNAETSEYFDAASFEVVDTTGAADAFAATLAVYLSRSYEMKMAIRYATYAAGFATTRQGVPPALVDQSTLELYLSDI